MKVKSILVSQPEPQAGNNPYTQLADKHKVKVDFRPFIEVVGVPAAEFRKDKVNPAEFKAFIFTSRNAIDHFFRMCEEMRVAINPEWKYFCVSEAVAFYLQKFVPYRKRKIYPGTGSLAGLIPTLKKWYTVASDLSDLSDVKYDILVFFSPEGIRSLLKNFPDFKQDATRIAAFGNTTHQAIADNALRLDIQVPAPKFTSMSQALDAYIEEANKSK
jgi:uroporphyrinogen-III synthase